VTQTGSRSALVKKEDQRERYNGLKVIGWGLLLVDIIVLFFVPAGFKVGNERAFLGIIFGLLAVGLAMIIMGNKRAKGQV